MGQQELPPGDDVMRKHLCAGGEVKCTEHSRQWGVHEHRSGGPRVLGWWRESFVSQCDARVGIISGSE